jgi:transketolase
MNETTVIETARVQHETMANAIRALSMDAVEKAKSGHPGMPMGMADVATVLFTKHLKFDPAWPDWPDRDRFVLSAGHGSMLLYSLLYLTGYEEMTIEEIKNFRQLGSHTAGHPEFDRKLGIETTTGPLGQGLATAVGMAIAERHLAARFGAEVVDHHTYVVAGDGCLMEGVSHEAISLAGHLKLKKLIVLFDDNHISIDGPTEMTVSDDQVARFKAHGWNAVRIDGHDPAAIDAAIKTARTSDMPTMIACRTTIGYGAPKKAGTAATHGSPLGEEEVAGARVKLGWPYPAFEIPDEILSAWRSAGERGAPISKAWLTRLNKVDAAKRNAFDAALTGNIPAALDQAIAEHKKSVSETKPKIATRAASQNVLEVINGLIETTIGGSADLTGSNNTKTSQLRDMSPNDYAGRYIRYGVREFGMAAAMNGLALHGGVIPYGGTFLVFADYCRPAIRLSALMRQRVIYVMTHDSIGLGEDGPTHQPVEHLASLRAMPNITVFRPADGVETAECWELALKSSETPSVLALSRQNLPTVRTTHTAENLSARGGYELRPANGKAKVTVIATGSEVEIALASRELLQADGISTRVVSMPSTELFDAQDASYREDVLGPGTVRVAVEAASPLGWDRYIGPDGAFVGMTSFGASAPAKALYEHFGITPAAVAAAAKDRL